MSTIIRLPMSHDPRISIIIPSQTPSLLRTALASIAADATGDVAFETIVVANGSSPCLAEELAAVADGIRIVRSGIQRGVAGGYNLGRQSARGDLIVLAHDDIEVESGWLRAWIEASDQLPHAGVIGGKVIHSDGTLRGAGFVLWSDGFTSPPWVGAPPPDDTFSMARAVDYTGSCSVLVRSEVWDAIGGLDEGMFPAYYVDVDLAMSARRAGWAVMYWPGVRVRHHEKPHRERRKRQFIAGLNRQRFMQRWAAELAAYPERGSSMEEAIRSAETRSAALIRPAVGLPPREALSDDSFVELQRELDKAYLAHLEGCVDTLEGMIAREASKSSIATSSVDPYVLGSVFSFALAAKDVTYETVGGHAPEAWGRWVGSEPFTIELPLGPLGATPDITWPIEIELTITHFVTAGRDRSPVSIEVNGVRVLDAVGTTADAQTYRGVIPERARFGRHAAVTIRTVGAASPCSLGLSIDKRLLGVGLISLVLR